MTPAVHVASAFNARTADALVSAASLAASRRILVPIDEFRQLARGQSPWAESRLHPT
jgi:hypothetical protein